MFLGFGPEYDVDLHAFVLEMEKTEPMDVILRCAVHIENQIIKALDQCLENSAALKSIRLDFFGRVALCEALGLPIDVAQMATAVGSVRNKLAHRLDYVFDAQKIGALEATAKGVGEAALKQAHRDLKTIKNDRGLEAFDLGVPLDRFKIFAFVTIVGIGAWQLKVSGAPTPPE